MSTYFVTGATGSIGRPVVAELLRRPACERVFPLARPRSVDELDAFSRVAAGETVAGGVTFTSVRMPLVRTPVIGPTEVDLPSGVPAEPARRTAPRTSPPAAVAAGITRLVLRATR